MAGYMTVQSSETLTDEDFPYGGLPMPLWNWKGGQTYNLRKLQPQG